MRKIGIAFIAFCIATTTHLSPTKADWTLSFSISDFGVTNVFNEVPDFNFELVVAGDIAPGVYNNPTLVSVDYNVFGLLPDGSPSGFPSFNLIRSIGGQEFYDQGSSISFEILPTADLSDGLQGDEVDMTFVLNCREVDTGRYHPALFELFGDGTGRLQNSNNFGGINPGNGMFVDVDFGEEYIVDLTYTPANLTLSTDTAAPPSWTMSFSITDFGLTPIFNDVPDFNFEFVFAGELVRGVYNNPTLVGVNYNVMGDLTPNGSPSGFPSFGLVRDIGGQEFYDQGSSINFEVLPTADLTDGLQADEVNSNFVLNCREVDTGRYHPALFELFGDGTGRLQNSNNFGGINPANGMFVDVDFGEEYIMDLTYTPASLTLSTDIGVDVVDINTTNGLPSVVNPAGGTTIRVEATANGETPAPGTGTLFYDIGGGFVSVPMTEVSPNVYDAVIPASACGTVVSYYFTVESTTGFTFSLPATAPANVFTALSASSMTNVLTDDFETDMGWTVSGDAIDGQWERGVPAGGGDRGDPAADADGSGSCFVTDNADDNSDVDAGSTTLTSPTLDATLGATDIALLSYSRWYSNDFGAGPNEDIFVVEISNDNGATWVNLETVGPTGPETGGGWIEKQFVISDFVAPTAQMRVRFTASDLNAGSIVEAGVDGLSIDILDCSGAETVPAASFNTFRGLLISGGNAEITGSDDAYLKHNPGFTLTNLEAPVWLIFDATLSTDSPTGLDLVIEASANTPGLTQTTEMFDFNTGQFVEIDVQMASFNTDTVIAVDVSSQIGDFVEAGTGAVRARAGWRQTGFALLFPWTVCVDQAAWNAQN